jgi:hypothetical protein
VVAASGGGCVPRRPASAAVSTDGPLCIRAARSYAAIVPGSCRRGPAPIVGSRTSHMTVAVARAARYTPGLSAGALTRQLR